MANKSAHFMFLSTSQSKNSVMKQTLSKTTRSNSLDLSDFDWPRILEKRLHPTFDFKLKGFKGNFRGLSIQEPYLTLHDLLSQTPDSLPLNIELSKASYKGNLIFDWIYLTISQNIPCCSKLVSSGNQISMPSR